MVDVAQLVRASDCGSEGRGFEPHLPPRSTRETDYLPLFFLFPHYMEIVSGKKGTALQHNYRNNPEFQSFFTQIARFFRRNDKKQALF